MFVLLLVASSCDNYDPGRYCVYASRNKAKEQECKSRYPTQEPIGYTQTEIDENAFKTNDKNELRIVFLGGTSDFGATFVAQHFAGRKVTITGEDKDSFIMVELDGHDAVSLDVKNLDILMHTTHLTENKFGSIKLTKGNMIAFSSNIEKNASITVPDLIQVPVDATESLLEHLVKPTAILSLVDDTDMKEMSFGPEALSLITTSGRQRIPYNRIAKLQLTNDRDSNKPLFISPDVDSSKSFSSTSFPQLEFTAPSYIKFSKRFRELTGPVSTKRCIITHNTRGLITIASEYETYPDTFFIINGIGDNSRYVTDYTVESKGKTAGVGTYIVVSFGLITIIIGGVALVHYFRQRNGNKYTQSPFLESDLNDTADF